MTTKTWLWTALLVMGLQVQCAVADGQVVLNGIMGDKALISVNGGAPRVMREGEIVSGVKLISLGADKVEVEFAGRRRSIGIGLGSGGSAAGQPNSETIILANAQGQFVTRGWINDASVLFLVDTGASSVALPESLAKRAGVSMQSASLVGVGTANGRIAAQKVLLNRIKVGDIELNMVEAFVVEDGRLPGALLGMSFLSRTRMKHDGDRLVLSPRY